MTVKKVSGVYAAVLTPRRSDDSVDVAALTKLIHFLSSKGISSFALNGSTGEFFLNTPKHLQTLLTTVREASDGKAKILCGIGAPGTSLTSQFAAIARQGDASAVLLPMPYFPNRQEDLDLYCREVAKSTDLPILLYNLPQITTGLEKETVCTLIAEVPNIIGIKDSSGSLDILRSLTERGIEACRMVGNDRALGPALTECVCDGVVSGVACALPEVILALYAQNQRTDSAEFRAESRFLNEFIEQMEAFPTPWGLKWIVEARGVISATFSQPVTEDCLARSRQLKTWFHGWLPSVIPGEKLHQ